MLDIKGGHGKRSEIPIELSQQLTSDKVSGAANNDGFVSIFCLI